MKKTAKERDFLLVVVAIALAWLALGTPSTQAQSEGSDAIDPAFTLSFTDVINNHNSTGVLQHFVQGADVMFDNSVFGIQSQTMSADEYAARQRPNQPDVPTDIRLEVVDGSLQINATSATWTWRETAGFLKGMNVDHIEFSVVATTEARRFKSLSIAPTTESLAKLLSLATTRESLAKLPYSPALPTLPFGPDGSIGPAPVVVRLESVGGMRVRGAAILTGKEGGSSISLHATGLTAGTSAQATLYGGTCATPGASFAALPALNIDASGTGTVTGLVLFRGTESVALATLADGDHVISINQSGRAVACARIPTMEGLPDNMPGMPRTGGPGGQMMLLMIAALSISLMLIGSRLRSTRTVNKERALVLDDILNR